MNTITIKKSKAKILKEIEDLFYSLSRVAESSRYFDELHNKNLESERQHRKWGSYGIKNHLSIIKAAKYFTCKHIIEGKTEKKPKVEDILDIRIEVFMGHALYCKYKEAFKKVITKDALKLMSEYDYMTFMNGEY